MTSKKNKAKRDLERIVKAKHAVAEAKQQYESLAIDDYLTNMVLERISIAFEYISQAYSLALKMAEQEGIEK